MSSVAEGGPISFTRAIRLVFSTAARHWRTCLPIAAMYAVPWGVANAVSRSSTRILDPRTLTTAETLTAAITWIASIGAMVVIALFLGSIAVGGLSLVGSAAVYGDVVETRGIVRRAFDKALDAVAANLLVLLLLSIAPVLVGMAAAAASLVSSSLGVAVLVFGSILVIAPTVMYVGVHLVLAVPVVMREGRGAVDSLRRSWSLVKGAWLWVLGIFVALGIVPAVVQRIAEPAIGRGGPADFLLWAIAGTIIAVLAVVLFGVGTGVVYACRAPEDVVPPDVVASEQRAEHPIEHRAEVIPGDTQDA
jgi:hypothetical protein